MERSLLPALSVDARLVGLQVVQRLVVLDERLAGDLDRVVGRAVGPVEDDHPALVDGEYVPLTPDHPTVWAYDRVGTGERLRVVLNWTDVPTDPPVDVTGENLIENYESTDRLRPYEARIHRHDGGQ